MNPPLALEHITDWIEPGRRKLQRMIERSARLRLLLLSLTHATGCLLMLTPAVLLLLTAAGAVQLSRHSQGPLDWFLVEVLAALALFSAFLSWQLYRTRPQRPGGAAIEAAQAPELFAMLERRAAHFRIRPVDTLLLTTGSDMRIRSTPCWPLPVRHHYCLCIGAPLLFFITPGQFRLALAGAVAATAYEQHHWAGRMVRLTEDWKHIDQALRTRPSLAARLLHPPLAALIRLGNYLGHDLDDERQQVQGRWLQENGEEKNAIDYLSSQVVTRAFLEQCYWPMIYKAAERSPTPVVKPFSHFGVLLEKLLDTGNARRWLLQAQVCKGNRRAELRELLAGLGIDHLQWPGLPGEHAFNGIFTSPAILKRLDSHWQHSIEHEWTRRHEQFRQDRLRFSKLQDRAGQLRGKSALRYVQLAARFLEPEQAADVCRNMCAINPADAGLHFASGRELINAGYIEEGCTALQRASELDSTLANQAHALISAHRQEQLEQRDRTVLERSA